MRTTKTGMYRVESELEVDSSTYNMCLVEEEDVVTGDEAMDSVRAYLRSRSRGRSACRMIDLSVPGGAD